MTIVPPFFPELQGVDEEPFVLRPVPNRVEQPCELKQASWFGAMAIWESFDLWPQYDQPWFVSIKVAHEKNAGVPCVDRARVNRCEDIEQVLDVHILRYNTSGLFKAGLVRINVDRQSTKVTILGCAEEWG